jgi:hypothetical protein
MSSVIDTRCHNNKKSKLRVTKLQISPYRSVWRDGFLGAAGWSGRPVPVRATRTILDWGFLLQRCLQLILESFFLKLGGRHEDNSTADLQRPQSPNPTLLWYSTDKLPSTWRKKNESSPATSGDGMVGVYSPACHTAARAEMRMQMLPLASGLGPRDSNSAPTATVQGYDGQCAVSPRPPPDGRDRRDTFRPAMTTSPLRTGRAIPSVKLAAPVWISVGFYTREYILVFRWIVFFDRYKRVFGCSC